MTKSPKEKGKEKQRLSDAINRLIDLSGSIDEFKIDWTFLRAKDLRKIEKRLRE